MPPTFFLFAALTPFIATRMVEDMCDPFGWRSMFPGALGLP